MRTRVIALAFIVAGLVVNVAAADPMSFNLAGDVQAGKKPQLSITASEKLTDIRIDLERDDGKTFSIKHAGLAKGGSVALPIGDGAAGKHAWKGTLSAAVASGQRWKEELTFSTLVRGGPLKVTYDAEHLDLAKRVLQFKLSRAAASAELVAIGEDGKELGKGSATITSEPTSGWHSITWTQPANTRVMILKLRVVAGDGAATNVELIPWSVNVEHEDVTFDTDSARIRPTETAKLDASLAKIVEVVKRGQKFMPMRLYIAGHTDTVGPNAKNRKLSLDRAVAIGAYLKKKGLKIAVSVAGFGEEVLKVPTADSTDEAKNRRADYVIGPANGAPPFKGPYLKAKATWKQLK